MVKFISSAYMPQDRDIVREMWVQGDLKEQLGIQHRRDIKKSAKSNLEQTPMFHRPHFRSESEISSFQPDADIHPQPISRSPLSTPSPSRSNTGSSLAQSQHSEDAVTPTARTAMNPSPLTFRGSYYSASNIPVPSPIPGSDEPPMSAVSSQPVAPYPQRSPPSRSPSGTLLQVPHINPRNHPPEAYEMHVRHPSDDQTALNATAAPHTFATADASYETAYDGYVQEPEHDGRLTAGDHDQDDSWRDSTYSTGSGPRVL